MHKEFDDNLRRKHGHHLVGIDEAGRGAWCGPIVGASVCLPEDFALDGLTDSKKLSENKRIEYYEAIKQQALAYSIQEVSPIEIDKNGITWANIQVMERSAREVERQLGKINIFVIDQSPINSLKPCMMMPKADSTSMSVAAASVLAKVYRDNLMYELSSKHPEYCFKQNKGYIDQKHVDIVNKLGIIKGLYRETYKVKGYNKDTQIKLF
jgi:ribonuclease HII